MRICPKCLSVYASFADAYCRNDGRMTVDTASEEGQKLVQKIKLREIKPNQW